MPSVAIAPFLAVDHGSNEARSRGTNRLARDADDNIVGGHELRHLHKGVPADCADGDVASFERLAFFWLFETPNYPVILLGPRNGRHIANVG